MSNCSGQQQDSCSPSLSLSCVCCCLLRRRLLLLLIQGYTTFQHKHTTRHDTIRHTHKRLHTQVSSVAFQALASRGLGWDFLFFCFPFFFIRSFFFLFSFCQSSGKWPRERALLRLWRNQWRLNKRGPSFGGRERRGESPEAKRAPGEKDIQRRSAVVVRNNLRTGEKSFFDLDASGRQGKSKVRKWKYK